MGADDWMKPGGWNLEGSEKKDATAFDRVRHNDGTIRFEAISPFSCDERLIVLNPASYFMMVAVTTTSGLFVEMMLRYVCLSI